MITFLYPWFLSPIESTVHIKIKELRYESSSRKLYKELSSSIFQSLWVSESGMRDTLPDLHFVQYIKASITKCQRLIVSYTELTQHTASSSCNAQLNQLDLVTCSIHICIYQIVVTYRIQGHHSHMEQHLCSIARWKNEWLEKSKNVYF